MSKSITLSNISWSTPDGHQLLENLDLTFQPERTGLVGRNGVGKSTLLNLIAGDISPTHGVVRADAHVGYFRQQFDGGLKDTIASILGLSRTLDLIEYADAGRATPEELAEIDWAATSAAEAALAECGLNSGLQTYVSSLSGGQLTRLGLVSVLLEDPDFILFDEPTNNLDAEGREFVLEFLQAWRKGAIIVSHDRQLLEKMDCIVELTSLGAKRYGGNYSTYHTLKAEELNAARHALSHAEKAKSDAIQKTKGAALRKARKDAAGRKSRLKRDAPKMQMDAAKERAEASGAANNRLREARRQDVEKQLSDARSKIEILQPLEMSIPSSNLPPSKEVLRITEISGGYEQEKPIFHNLSFEITGPERIAITGPNGSGKTTLLSVLTGKLQPLEGQLSCYVTSAFLDQTVSILSPDISLRANFMALNPTATENEARSALARFQFRGDDAMKLVKHLSGGQKLRAGLACTLGQPVPPQLLVLDEPTNHLDLDTIAEIEKTLGEYDGALLVVSHDETFLENIGVTRRIELPERS